MKKSLFFRSTVAVAIVLMFVVSACSSKSGQRTKFTPKNVEVELNNLDTASTEHFHADVIFTNENNQKYRVKLSADSFRIPAMLIAFREIVNTEWPNLVIHINPSDESIEIGKNDVTKARGKIGKASIARYENYSVIFTTHKYELVR